MKISALTPDGRNANKGTARGRKVVRESLRKYGAGRSILLDRNGHIIAGNKTVEGATALGMEDVQVVKSDGSKLIAVQRTDLDINDKKARELAIADNRAGELGLEWDTDVLKQFEAEEIDLTSFWDERELVQFFARTLDITEHQPQLDKADELRRKWNVRTGQLWAIPSATVKGKYHRLLCGDSTSQADADRLLGDELLATAITDPPYNVDIDYGSQSSDSKDVDEYRKFTRSWFEIARARCHQVLLTPGTGRGVGMPNLHIWFAIRRPDWILVWFKSNTVGHSSLGGFNAWEPIFFYGKPLKKIGQDVYDIPITVQAAVSDGSGGKLHPTPKQVKLWAALIEDFTNEGGVIYEPFVGSGTSHVASEQTGRICYGIEIEPKYVAVALERMADMGLQPVLANA